MSTESETQVQLLQLPHYLEGKFQGMAYLQSAWLKWQIVIFSLFWKLKVQDQGVGRYHFFEDFLLGLQMAAFLLCPHMAFPLCVPLCV